MQILQIAGYKFIALSDLESLHEQLLTQCEALQLKGTILLSEEGINLSVAATSRLIQHFQDFLRKDERFADISFHETYAPEVPFRKLKVKVKKEIITLKKPILNFTEKRAPHITPAAFKQWLDEKRTMTILDTRNVYEVNFGTFSGATHLQLSDFSEFADAAQTIEKDKPIVMFCTGGIRCEKAALHMLDQDYTDVYQLDGGILGYFAKVGGAHYEGECFVFDERISVNSQLQITGTAQCSMCQQPVTKEEQQSPLYIVDVSCPHCA
jgi:UPF0176 protein